MVDVFVLQTSFVRRGRQTGEVQRLRMILGEQSNAHEKHVGAHMGLCPASS